MPSWLTTPAYRLLGLLMALLAAVGMVFAAGKRSQIDADRVEDLQDYVDTQEAVKDVVENTTRSDAIERLRDNDLLR